MAGPRGHVGHARVAARRGGPGHRGPRLGEHRAPAATCSTPFGAATDQELDDDAPSITQLGETSDLVAELARHPVPDTIHAVSIAARGDLVVPVPRSRAPGMDEVVVPLMGPSAHSDLPASAQATRELALARAGLPPGCQTFREALLDQGAGEGISLLEDLRGAGGFLVAARADVRGA